ncbi:Citrate/oxoglutarate carrier protein [Venturia inaequalis]|nr:Citrate/oxoglutarate carrier protein [Venturia inaequalis]
MPFPGSSCYACQRVSLPAAHVYHLYKGYGISQLLGTQVSLPTQRKSSYVNMSASSGAKGSCNICHHMNDGHNSYKCTVPKCKNKWKVCQAGGHQEWNESNDYDYVVCVRCKDHPKNCQIESVHDYKYIGG